MKNLAIVLFFGMASTAWAYSAGAPEAVCDNMTPQHPVDPQKSDLPYHIHLSKNEVKPGQTVEITIGTKAFKGYLLQVRNGNKAVGSFDIPTTDKYSKAINCHGTKNSAATHKSSTPKKDLVLKWTAPQAKGTYKVYATVAEDGHTFWARRPTGTIKVQ